MLNLKIPSGVSKLLSKFNDQTINNTSKNARSAGWALLTEDGGVLDFDTIISIDVDSTNKIMQSPTEVGGFAMYNKAVGPTIVTLDIAVCGSEERRARTVSALMDLSGSTDLLTLITPEYEYKGFNVDSCKYSRNNDDGVDAVYLTLSLTEVRQVTAQYTNAKINRKKSNGKKNGKESALSGMFSYF